MDSPVWLRKFLGWGSVVVAVLAIAVFVIAVVKSSGVIAAGSVVLLLVLAGFLWTWAWLDGANDQRIALGKNESYHDVKAGSPSAIVAPRTSALVARHPVIAMLVLLVGFLGAASIAYATGYLGLTDPSAGFWMTAGIVLIALAVSGAVTVRPQFRDRENLRRIVALEPGAGGWGLMLTAGLRTFILGSDPSLHKRDLRSTGYVLLTQDGFEFWQREKKDLVRVLAIGSTSITDVDSGLVTWGFQSQNGVQIHVRMDSGAVEVVPIAVQAMLGPSQTWPQGTQQIVDLWATLSRGA